MDDLERIYDYFFGKSLVSVLRPKSLGRLGDIEITEEMVKDVNTTVRDLNFKGDDYGELDIVGAFRVADRSGEVITEALALLALMGTLTKKFTVTLICNGTHPTIRRVWDMLNKRERIAAYSKWSPTAVGQEAVKGVEDELNGDAQYVDVWKGAPQGSDSAWHLTIGPKLKEVMGVQNSDLTIGEIGSL